MFWPELRLKPCYVALHVTENGKVFFKHCPPPPFIRDHIDSVDCTLGYTLGRRSRMKGGNDVLENVYVFCWM